MAEVARTYSQRVFTMINGLVAPVMLDDWYWQHYDWLVSEEGNMDADAARQNFLKVQPPSRSAACSPMMLILPI